MNTAADEQAPSDSLKRQFLDRATSLASLAEAYRSPLLTQLLAEALACGLPIEAEIFQAAYGEPTGRAYWYGQLSEPIRVGKLAYVLSLHGAESAERFEWAKMSTVLAFRDAAAAGEDFFIGDTEPLLALRDGQSNFGGINNIKVHPRAAINWLLSKPKRQHLIHESLLSFLQVDMVSTRPRRLNKESAERYVDEYINDAQSQGRRPTIEDLETAAKANGIRGGRELLRAAFDRLVGRGQGRPRKAATKSAEK